MKTNPHARRAERVIDDLGEEIIAGEGITDATIVATALEANTQAALALAHEQRTANLIAAAESMLIEGSERSRSMVGAMRQEIIARLVEEQR